MERRSVDRYRALIAAAFPEFAASEVRFLGEGWDSAVFEVDGAMVFRFPKRAAVERSLLKEIRLLAEAGPLLPLPVPRFTHVSGPVLDYPWHFAGYRRLPGTQLSVADPDPAALEVLAEDLGRFLAALHAFPVARATALGAPTFMPETWRARHARLYQRARGAIAARFGDRGTGRLDALWQVQMCNLGGHDFSPVLVHGDLVPEHVLVEARPWRVSGIIDFGDAMVTDAALDYAGFPEPVARAMLAAAGRAPDARFWERWRLYRRAAPLRAITAGQDLGRPDLIADGLDALEREWLGGDAS